MKSLKFMRFLKRILPLIIVVCVLATLLGLCGDDLIRFILEK